MPFVKASPPPDEWSRWLLGRDAGDPIFQETLQRWLESMRDRILDGAKLSPDSKLLDVGSGDGLLAFGAIERIGRSLRAVLVDLSPPLLHRAQEIAAERGMAQQCEFHLGLAHRLSAIADRSVNAVVTRAVIAYVADKPAAFKEFYRVLTPGGRLSIGEPIYQDDALELIAMQQFIDAQPDHPQIDILRLMHRMKAGQFPSTQEAAAANPITNFSERDLIGMARAAGFVDIHLELHVDVAPALVRNWDVFLTTSPHPWARTPGEILAKHFSPAERSLYETHMRPAIESGISVSKDTFAYLTASRPPSPLAPTPA